MKILSVEEAKDPKQWGQYLVTIKFNWFERLIGDKDGVFRFKPTGEMYNTGTNEYQYGRGLTTGPYNKVAQAIDKFRRGLERW